MKMRSAVRFGLLAGWKNVIHHIGDGDMSLINGFRMETHSLHFTGKMMVVLFALLVFGPSLKFSDLTF